MIMRQDFWCRKMLFNGGLPQKKKKKKRREDLMKYMRSYVPSQKWKLMQNVPNCMIGGCRGMMKENVIQIYDKEELPCYQQFVPLHLSLECILLLVGTIIISLRESEVVWATIFVGIDSALFGLSA